MSTFKQRGYLTCEQVMELPGYPGRERLLRGAVAVIECAECIPCNPCETACPHGAISVGHPITGLPSLDGEKCVGCGLCIPHCPGQAIFVVDASGENACVSFPYELLPMPEKGEIWDGCDRSGAPVTKAKILRVVRPASFDRTAVVTVEVEKSMADKVRFIRRRDA